MRYRHQIRPQVKRSKKGCLTCREIHTKCDEKKPSCSRCLRLQMKCVGHGYTLEPRELAQQVEAQRQLIRNKIQSNSTARPLLPSGGTVYLHHFVTFCSKALFFADDQTDNPFASEIFSHFPGCEHLQLAVNALSASHLQRRQHGHSEKYFNFYGRAVRNLSDAIADAPSTSSIAILLSVLLLGFCEISSSNNSAWLSHIQGAKDILVLRGGPSKEPVLARVFSFIDVGSSFFLGRESLLPLDYLDDGLVMDASSAPGQYWPCWDTTGASTQRLNQRLRILASLSRFSSEVKQHQSPILAEALLLQAQEILSDINEHWSAPIFEKIQILRPSPTERAQVVLEDIAAKSACMLALIDTTAPIIGRDAGGSHCDRVFSNPTIATKYIDTILAICSVTTEHYCLVGLPWPLFMAGIHLFRDGARERAILQAMRAISSVIFHPFEGAIRLLQTLWRRQWAEGTKVSWRRLLDESGESIYIML